MVWSPAPSEQWMLQQRKNGNGVLRHSAATNNADGPEGELRFQSSALLNAHATLMQSHAYRHTVK